MTKKWMIYGANGYTGRLIARAALQRGLQPVLAGRDEDSIRGLAEETGFASRIFRLDDREALAAGLEGMSLVLHCAGPFSATSQPMLSACIDKHVHYVDISGEISVFANAFRRSEEARAADIVLLPGAGFDVVPTDCMAASLVRALPAATAMLLAFESSGGISPGTAKTSVEGLARGGCVRKAGKLVSVPLAWKTREIPFAHGNRLAVTIPWGDVFTAHVSTGVPDIEVYMAAPPALIKGMKRLRMLKPLLSLRWVQDLVKRRIGKSVSGPGKDERDRARVQLWGEVSSADGRRVSATMATPDAYDVTAAASLGIVRHLLDNDVEGGFYTPSLLMGAAYAESLPGVSLAVHS